MQFWIEVTGDRQWSLRLNGELGLNAPLSKRYRKILKKIKENDVILHHITTKRAEESSHKGAIVGISKAVSKMSNDEDKLLVCLNDTIEIPNPIGFVEYSEIKNPSKKFEFLLHINMQRYIIEIEKQDVTQIIGLDEEDLSFLKKHSVYKDLFD